MMRPHCDRCDTLAEDGYCHWTEDSGSLWHFRVWKGGRDPEDVIFCKECVIILLKKYVEDLESIIPPAAPTFSTSGVTPFDLESAQAFYTNLIGNKIETSTSGDHAPITPAEEERALPMREEDVFDEDIPW